jgi:hypothetical protein
MTASVEQMRSPRGHDTCFGNEGGIMNNVLLKFPVFGFVVATRAMLGVGIGLLLSERLPARRRRRIGMTLATIGAASTLPAAIAVLRGRTDAAELRARTPQQIAAVV